MTDNRSIAIVGVACRFPEANTLTQYWDNVRAGRNCIRTFSPTELRQRGADPDTIKNPNFVPAGGLIDDVDMFDPEFFNMTVREAEITDPQQRLFLELCWQAWEDAGYARPTQPGNVGVFGGTTINTYFIDRVLKNNDLVRAVGDLQLMIGNDKDFLTSRVSHRLNFGGPSVVVQTACSTSLAAVHMACASLLSHECDAAVAGGTSVRFPYGVGYVYQPGGTSSADGICRSFDKNATGSVVGSGGGVVVLKRLEDAIADNDTIYASILGSAIGSCGMGRAGFSTPTAAGQSRAILEAWGAADVDPATIGYVEAHGTGTIVGDPIEVEGLTTAFRYHTTRSNFCALGSVKANIGHLDAGAGIASLLKAAMVVRNGEIPPQINFEEPNPKLNLDISPFYINRELKDWASDDPRRAGVSSIGMGGINVHMVVEEPPPRHDRGGRSDTNGNCILLPISARRPETVSKIAENLADCISGDQNLNLDDVAFTLLNGRTHFEYRAHLSISSAEEAVSKLRSLSHADVANAAIRSADPSNVIFAFPGQGVAFSSVFGEQLYESEAVFRDAYKSCADIADEYIENSLISLAFDTSGSKLLDQTMFAQPVIFALSFAASQLLMSRGVTPTALLGHSVGELTAAAVAGVFSLQDAMMLVCKRGSAMQRCQPGAMLAVNLPSEAASILATDGIDLAVDNGDMRSVLAGPEEKILALEEQLRVSGVRMHRLASRRAFHSWMMESAVEEFLQDVKLVELSDPKIPILSNVTGTWLSPAEATDPEYWARHISTTVRFRECLEEAFRHPKMAFLEVGPGPSVSVLAEEMRQKGGHGNVISSWGDRGEVSEQVEFSRYLGKAWAAGVSLQSYVPDGDNIPRKVALPSYPFVRKKIGLEPVASGSVVRSRPVVEKRSEAPPASIKRTQLDTSSEKRRTVAMTPSDEVGTLLTVSSDQLHDVLNALQSLAKIIGGALPGGIPPSFHTQTETSLARERTPSYSPEHWLGGKSKKNQTFQSIQLQPEGGLNRTQLINLVKEIVEETLGIRLVDLDQSLSDLGAHSLIQLQILQRLNQRLGGNYSKEEVLGLPTINGIVDHLVDLSVKSSSPSSSAPARVNFTSGGGSDVKSVVRQIVKDLLGVEEISDDDDLSDHGAHSLMLTQLVSRLRETLQIDLPLDAVFSKTSIRELAEFITSDSQPSTAKVAAPAAESLFRNASGLPEDQLDALVSKAELLHRGK